MTEMPGGGWDTVSTWVDGYTLAENVEVLRLTGEGWISAAGNAQDNIIIGNGRANILDGGAGDDTVTGNGAADYEPGHLQNHGDTFVTRKGDGNDTLTDFKPGANLGPAGHNGGDNIRLVGFGDQFRQLSDVLARTTEVDGALVIDLGGGQTLTLLPSRTDADGATIPLSKSDLDHHDFDYGAHITNAVQSVANGQASVTLQGTAEIYAEVSETYKIYVAIKDLSIPDPTKSGANIIGYAEVTDGRWSFTIEGLADTAHSYAVASLESKWGEDLKWHYSELSTSEAVTPTPPPVEAVEPPAAPVLAVEAGHDTGLSATDGVTREAVQHIAGTAAAGTLVDLYQDGVRVAQGLAVTDGHWSYTTAALPEGAHAVTPSPSRAISGPLSPRRSS